MKYILLLVTVLVLGGCSRGVPSLKSAYPDEERSEPIDTRGSGEEKELTVDTIPDQAVDTLKDSILPGMQEIENPVRQVHPILDQLTLPDGVGIEIYAEVSNARSLEVVDEGDEIVVFVGNRKEDKVYALVDTDRDGEVDETLIIARGLNSPNGVAYRDGDLYVAEISRILLFPNILETLPNPAYEVFFDDLPDDDNHGRKFIAFDPDGHLTIPVGAPCNNCDAGLPYSAIHSLDIETKELSLIAQGVRNTVGFDRHPETKDFWFTDNGRDWFGNDIPPDELNVLTESEEHFGFPFCHGGDLKDTEFTSRNCDEFTPPVAKLGPHVAALGMIFSDTISAPEKWKNHVLIAEHGSWNRTPAIGYRITAVNLETNEYSIFLDGWLQGLEVLGRPVDLAALPDGSLLVSDDGAGVVYKVTFE